MAETIEFSHSERYGEISPGHVEELDCAAGEAYGLGICAGADLFEVYYG